MNDLRGSLLISNGSLFDPNFRHTVVLICEHSPEGALGVVLNRPTHVKVADAIPAFAEVVPEGATVFIGGPVQPQAALMLADLEHPDLAGIVVTGTVGLLSGEVDDIVVDGIRRARVFAGYSGWGGGQLEAELARDDWIVEPAIPDELFTDAPERLWGDVLARKGGQFRLLSRMPFDPSSN